MPLSSDSQADCVTACRFARLDKRSAHPSRDGASYRARFLTPPPCFREGDFRVAAKADSGLALLSPPVSKLSELGARGGHRQIKAITMVQAKRRRLGFGVTDLCVREG